MSDTISNILFVLTKFSPKRRNNPAPPYDVDDFDDDDEENDGGSSAGRGAECHQ